MKPYLGIAFACKLFTALSFRYNGTFQVNNLEYVEVRMIALNSNLFIGGAVFRYQYKHAYFASIASFSTCIQQHNVTKVLTKVTLWYSKSVDYPAWQLTPLSYSIVESKHKETCPFCHVSTIGYHSLPKTFGIADGHYFIIHGQRRGRRCPGDTRSRSIIRIDCFYLVFSGVSSTLEGLILSSMKLPMPMLRYIFCIDYYFCTLLVRVNE